MNSRQLFALLRAKFGSMLVLGLFLAAISFVGLIFFEKPYQSSMDFLVVETGKVNTEFLPFDKKDRLKTWSQTVFVKNNLELGIISVTVKSDRERDAARIMDGITLVLTQQNSLFRGGDEKSVDISILSGPILERNPTTSEIFKVVLGGFFAGLFLTGVWLIVRNENFLKNKEAAKVIPFDNLLV